MTLIFNWLPLAADKDNDMGINRQVAERWEFGRMYLDFTNPMAPKGGIVYVQRDGSGAAIPGREITLDAGPELIGPLVSQATTPGINVGTNIVLLCDALMQSQGKIAGGVSDMEAMQEAAAEPAPVVEVPAEPVLNTEDADLPPAADPAPATVEPLPAEAAPAAVEVAAEPVPADTPAAP